MVLNPGKCCYMSFVSNNYMVLNPGKCCYLSFVSNNYMVLNPDKCCYMSFVSNNYMVLNPGKCCYMSFVSNPDKSDLILQDSIKVSSPEDYVILEVTIDNRLTFYNHLKNFC